MILYQDLLFEISYRKEIPSTFFIYIYLPIVWKTLKTLQAPMLSKTQSEYIIQKFKC